MDGEKGKLTLTTIADGALQEQFDRCLDDVLKSYRDETRDERAKREVTLKLTFVRRADSNLIGVTTEASTKLPAVRGAMGFISDEGNGFEAVNLPKAKQEEMFGSPATVVVMGKKE